MKLWHGYQKNKALSKRLFLSYGKFGASMLNTALYMTPTEKKKSTNLIREIQQHYHTFVQSLIFLRNGKSPIVTPLKTNSWNLKIRPENMKKTGKNPSILHLQLFAPPPPAAAPPPPAAAPPATTVPCATPTPGATTVPLASGRWMAN